MDRKNDFKEFAGMMATMAEALPGSKLSPEKIEIFFQALQDMDLETIKQRMLDHLRYNKFFPTVAEIRNEDPELNAQEDYKLIERLCRDFIFEGFQRSGMQAIDMKLRDMGKAYLMPMVMDWGSEIVYGGNPTATRAQFLKAYKAEQKHLRLKAADERAALEQPKLKQLTDKSGKGVKKDGKGS